MSQMVIRNIEAGVKHRLARRAKRHGRSMEEEAREILRGAVKMKATPNRGLGTEISSLFRKIGLDTDIPELRGYRIQPASFAR